MTCKRRKKQEITGGVEAYNKTIANLIRADRLVTGDEWFLENSLNEIKIFQNESYQHTSTDFITTTQFNDPENPENIEIARIN